jgi:hypothetical protein
MISQALGIYKQLDKSTQAEEIEQPESKVEDGAESDQEWEESGDEEDEEWVNEHYKDEEFDDLEEEKRIKEDGSYPDDADSGVRR